MMYSIPYSWFVGLFLFSSILILEIENNGGTGGNKTQNETIDNLGFDKYNRRVNIE